MSNDRLNSALSALTGLISRLRGPDGCPWDAQQTDSSVKMYLLEEAYEVLDAIETGSPEEVCQELGDLLFQIIFLARMAQERGEFDLAEVMEKITEKMINRHPHVFGQVTVDSPEEVSDNWEKIKKTEKVVPKEVSGYLQEIPVDLPALLRAHRLSYRASKVGFDWENREATLDKVKEEFEELNRCNLDKDMERVGEEFGDLLFSLVNLARHWGFNAERLLRDGNRKFIRRFRDMEEELKASGIELHDATPEEMDRAWEKIKVKTG